MSTGPKQVPDRHCAIASRSAGAAPYDARDSGRARPVRTVWFHAADGAFAPDGKAGAGYL